MNELSDYEICEICYLLRKYAEDLEYKGLLDKAGEMHRLRSRLLASHVYVSPFNT